jgi:hypothetical protein
MPSEKFMKNTMTLGILTLALYLTGTEAKAQTSLEYLGGPHANISQPEIQAIKSWSQNALADIDRLINNVQPMLDSSDQKRKLFNGMETIVQNSDPKAADLLLRHAIYAGLTVNKLIEQESIRKGMDYTAQGTVDQQVRILKKSLTMAKDYYKSDFAFINGMLSKKDGSAVNPNLVDFGLRFSQFLIKMSDGVLDASASYGMIRWSLGILSNYMNQDSRNIAYASTIKYLHDELRQYPDIVAGQMAPEDITCIKYTRELKRIALAVYKEVADTNASIQTTSPTNDEATRPTQPTQSRSTETEISGLGDVQMFNRLKTGINGCKIVNRGGDDNRFSVQFESNFFLNPTASGVTQVDRYSQEAVYSYSDIIQTVRTLFARGECAPRSSRERATVSQLLSDAMNKKLGICSVRVRGGDDTLFSLFLENSAAKRAGNKIVVTDAYDQSAVESLSSIAQTVAVAARLPLAQNGCF